MANPFNYRSNKILGTSDLLQELYRQSRSSLFRAAQPDSLRTYSNIQRADLYGIIQHPERIICDQLIAEGLMISDNPFPLLKEALPRMLDFRNDPGYSGISIIMHYEERGCSQNWQYCNSLSLVSHGIKWGVSVHFGGTSKLFVAPDGTSQNGRILYFNEALGTSYLSKIQNESGLFFNKPKQELLLTLKQGNLGQDFPLTEDPCALIDRLKKVYSLFSGGRIFKAAWHHSIMDERYAEQHAIEHLNKIAERKIKADNYKIEMRCRFTTWEALEQIQQLSAPDESQMHHLGEWKLKGHNTLKLIVATNSKGHEFIVQSKKPLHPKPDLLPSDVLVAVNGLGIDLSKPANPKDFLRTKEKL